MDNEVRYCQKCYKKLEPNEYICPVCGEEYLDEINFALADAFNEDIKSKECLATEETIDDANSSIIPNDEVVNSNIEENDSDKEENISKIKEADTDAPQKPKKTFSQKISDLSTIKKIVFGISVFVVFFIIVVIVSVFSESNVDLVGVWELDPDYYVKSLSKGVEGQIVFYDDNTFIIYSKDENGGEKNQYGTYEKSLFGVDMKFEEGFIYYLSVVYNKKTGKLKLTNIDADDMYWQYIRSKKDIVIVK